MRILPYERFITPSEDIPNFTAVDWEHYPTVFVKCDRERDRDKPGLLGPVKINGVMLYNCVGVERHLPLRPIQPGEIIGLVVEKLL